MHACILAYFLFVLVSYPTVPSAIIEPQKPGINEL